MRPLSLRNAGVSLIELMVALAIGCVLVLGLVEVFAASRTAYQLSEGMSRTQENARFAMDYLQRDIRMAGHYGCINDQSHLQTAGALVSNFPAALPASWGIDFPVSVRGYDANGTTPGTVLNLAAPTAGWTPALPAALGALGAMAGSDVIELRYLSNEGVPVRNITNPTSTSTLITVDPLRFPAMQGNGVPNPTMFGVADCSSADVFPASAIDAAAGTVSVATAITRYTPQPAGQTMLYRAESIVFYIAPGASGQPALFRARSTSAGTFPVANREELVEGIENMQLLFGLDRVTNLATTPPSGYIDVNQAASGVTNTAVQWRRVGLVQVGLLARSPDIAMAIQPTSTDRRRRALGVEFASAALGDSRYRASYEATIALRNRLYGN